MPEGDTIWRAASELQRHLGGRRVDAARPVALTRLVGRTLLRVEPIGKHIYMHFSGGIVLHTHMRMTGAWHVYATAQRRRRAPHLTTAVLGFGDVQAILFAAPVCELIGAAAVGSGLGPDILAAAFDVREVMARARVSPRPTIAEVLLDQAVCAGIGNIFRCDALWHERIDPMTAVSELDDRALAALYNRARDLMRRAAVADRFRARKAVHGRAGAPCTVCGTLIRGAPLGSPARIVFWCPRCQFGAGARAVTHPGLARSPSRQHPVSDHDPLQQGSGENERVEDLVESEGARPRVGTLDGIDDRAGDVHRATQR
jgi:endonuclease-8